MKRVLVIGDIIADAYESCEFRKMCPDAPDVRAIVRRSYDVIPGGAANVAANLCALSPDVRVTLIGEIDTGLARTMKRTTGNRVDLAYAQMTDEVLLTKKRVELDGKLILRIDTADRVTTFTAENIEWQLKSYLSENDPDLVLLSDYGHGTISPATLEILLGCRERLLVDTKMTDLSIFDGTLLCKLNQLEWNSACTRESAPERFFRYLVVTLGPAGALLHMRRELAPGRSQTDRAHFPPHKVDALDVCGCGDTFLAGLASSMLLNDDPFTAVQFANAAAATVVTQRGTAVADRDSALRLLGLETESETR